MWGPGAPVARYHSLPSQEAPRPDALEEEVSGQTVASKAEGQFRCPPGEAGHLSFADPERQVSLEVMGAERMCPIKFNLSFSS